MLSKIKKKKIVQNFWIQHVIIVFKKERENIFTQISEYFIWHKMSLERNRLHCLPLGSRTSNNGERETYFFKPLKYHSQTNAQNIDGYSSVCCLKVSAYETTFLPNEEHLPTPQEPLHGDCITPCSFFLKGTHYLDFSCCHFVLPVLSLYKWNHSV